MFQFRLLDEFIQENVLTQNTKLLKNLLTIAIHNIKLKLDGHITNSSIEQMASKKKHYCTKKQKIKSCTRPNQCKIVSSARNSNRSRMSSANWLDILVKIRN